MAIIWWDDFEWLGTLSWRYIGNAGVFSASTSIEGMTNRCLRGSANATLYAETTFPYAVSEGIFSAACKIEAGTISQRNLLALANDSTVNIAVRLNSDLSISILRNATVLNSSTGPVVPVNKRIRIEVKFVIADSTGGEVIVRIDSGGGMQEAVAALATDTNESGGTVNTLRLYNQNAVNVYWDDLWLDTDKTASRNDYTFHRLAPTGDASKVSTPSTGSTAWATIDETPFSTSDFNTFPVGEDLLNLADLSFSPYAIQGVGIMYLANKTVGDPVGMRARLLSSGVYSSGTIVSPNAVNALYSEFVPLEPSASGSWTSTTINNMQLSIERTT